MTDRIFRIFNPGEPKGDPVERRRAQLRRAQQSYRGRKDKYARTLEEELAKSRSREAELARECEQLRAGLQNALTGLSPQNATLNTYTSPSGTTGSSSGASPMYLGDPGYQVVDIVPSPQLISPPSFGGLNEPIESHGTPVLFNDGEFLANSRLSEVDQIVAGMEFVLKIEEPCLGHLHGDPKKPHEPGNHCMTASAQLMAASGDTSQTNNPRLPTSPAFGQTPTAMLERLLTLAPDLSGEDELTPVQAWDNIRNRPNFGGLDTRSLGVLARKLMAAAKCHGFGATIKRSVFEGLVYETLISGQNL
ncbi:hypothetical protein F53441_279 [Fusarium austroafricanum]|uniref:BZIP domain-containing protein n=1 Tax=Fusarium austroafricanum TaxID=2364996 RepID=A0A8H4KWA5_9HYPO|nr:hypothetical protein F53441_279 [Fusarium austroafricanum]